MRVKTLLASAALVMLLALSASAAPLLVQADRYEGNISRAGSSPERTVLTLKYDAVTGAPLGYLQTLFADGTKETKTNGTFTVKEDRATGAFRFTLKPRAAGGESEKFMRTAMGVSLRARNKADSGTLLPTGAQLLRNGREIMRLPSSYRGTIPAASGPGILLEATFKADRTFRVTETYIGEPEGSNKFCESGRWSVKTVNKKPLLILNARGGSRYFEIGDKSLTLVDSHGRAAQSKLNYTLSLTPGNAGDLFKKSFLMKGEYSQTGETGVFRDAAGRKYLVAKAGANAELERAYSERDTVPGKYLPAVVIGSLVVRNGDDDQPEEMLLVERLVALGSLETALVKGDWKIVSAGGVSAPANPEGETPFLRFGTDGRFYGYAGCNRIAGSYIVSAMKLTLDGILSTKMACHDMRLEDALLSALSHVRSYSIENGVLLLKGADGKTLAELTDK